jgi:hypothetical protein
MKPLATDGPRFNGDRYPMLDEAGNLLTFPDDDPDETVTINRARTHRLLAVARQALVHRTVTLEDGTVVTADWWRTGDLDDLPDADTGTVTAYNGTTPAEFTLVINGRVHRMLLVDPARFERLRSVAKAAKDYEESFQEPADFRTFQVSAWILEKHDLDPLP